MSYFSEVDAVSTWMDLSEIAEKEGCELAIVYDVQEQGKMFCVTVDKNPDGQQYYETLEGISGFLCGLQLARRRFLR